MKFFWSTDEEHNLYLLLASTRHMIYKLRKRELAKYNLSPVESGVIGIVQSIDKKKATPSNIARLLSQEPHAISMLLNRMAKKGLIRRKKDLGKKNLVRIELTKKGHLASEEAMKSTIVKEIISSLNSKQRQNLENILEILWLTAQMKLGTDIEAVFVNENE